MSRNSKYEASPLQSLAYLTCISIKQLLPILKNRTEGEHLNNLYLALKSLFKAIPEFEEYKEYLLSLPTYNEYLTPLKKEATNNKATLNLNTYCKKMITCIADATNDVKQFKMIPTDWLPPYPEALHIVTGKEGSHVSDCKTSFPEGNPQQTKKFTHSKVNFLNQEPPLTPAQLHTSDNSLLRNSSQSSSKKTLEFTWIISNSDHDEQINVNSPETESETGVRHRCSS